MVTAPGLGVRVPEPGRLGAAGIFQSVSKIKPAKVRNKLVSIYRLPGKVQRYQPLHFKVASAPTMWFILEWLAREEICYLNRAISDVTLWLMSKHQ